METLLKDTAFESVEKIRVDAVDSKHSAKYFTLPVESVLSINHRVTDKEYACLASHLEAIRMFSKSNFKTALIFEDDVSLDTKPYWTTLQQVMDKAPKDWEILHLCNYQWRQKERYYKLTYPCYDAKFKTNNTCRWRSAAYLLHKRAAVKLMRLWNGKTYRLPAKIFHMADYLMYNLLTTYVYRTPYFIVRKNNDSQIQSDYPSRINQTRRKILATLKKQSRRSKNT